LSRALFHYLRDNGVTDFDAQIGSGYAFSKQRRTVSAAHARNPPVLSATGNVAHHWPAHLEWWQSFNVGIAPTVA
jgi:hypothetical protein